MEKGLDAINAPKASGDLQTTYDGTEEQRDQAALTNSSILRKIKECLEMADEVTKINLTLREQNKELSEKYEKERAKVFQLNFELEKRNKPKINKLSNEAVPQK